MDALIENAVVITCDAEGTVIENGAVAVRGKRILEVGESGEMRRKYESLDRIDASGRAVMPGFVNAHTHSVLTVLRGTVEDMGGDAIYGYMSPISFAMTDEDRRAMNALGCLEAIRSGTTTMVDPFRHVYQYAQTMADSGLRLFLSESCADALNLKIRYGIYEYSEEWGQQFLDRTETAHRGIPRDGRGPGAVPGGSPRARQLLPVDATEAAGHGGEARASADCAPGAEPERTGPGEVGEREVLGGIFA